MLENMKDRNVRTARKKMAAILKGRYCFWQRLRISGPFVLLFMNILTSSSLPAYSTATKPTADSLWEEYVVQPILSLTTTEQSRSETKSGIYLKTRLLPGKRISGIVHDTVKVVDFPQRVYFARLHLQEVVLLSYVVKPKKHWMRPSAQGRKPYWKIL